MLELVLSKSHSSENDLELSIDEIARKGAQNLLKKAFLEEVNAYLQKHADCRNSSGNRLVVKNGKSKERTILTGTGEIKERFVYLWTDGVHVKVRLGDDKKLYLLSFLANKTILMRSKVFLMAP